MTNMCPKTLFGMTRFSVSAAWYPLWAFVVVSLVAACAYFSKHIAQSSEIRHWTSIFKRSIKAPSFLQSSPGKDGLGQIPEAAVSEMYTTPDTVEMLGIRSGFLSLNRWARKRGRKVGIEDTELAELM